MYSTVQWERSLRLRCLVSVPDGGYRYSSPPDGVLDASIVPVGELRPVVVALVVCDEGGRGDWGSE